MDIALNNNLVETARQYKQQIVLFLNTIVSLTSAFNPVIPAFDYNTVLNAIQTADPTVSTSTLRAIEDCLTKIQDEAIANLVSGPNGVKTVIDREVACQLEKIRCMPLDKLVRYVDSGQLSNSITTALATAGANATMIVNNMLNCQIKALQDSKIPSAAVAAASTLLEGNATAIKTAVDDQLNTLKNGVTTADTNLSTTTQAFLTAQAAAFQALALSKSKEIIGSIFGKDYVPTA
jgi:hypothetical protein